MHFIMFGKSFINNTKHRGHKALHCGAPFNCLMPSEKAFLTSTRIFLTIRNDFN